MKKLIITLIGILTGILALSQESPIYTEALTVEGSVEFEGTGAALIHRGTEAQRPTPTNGMIRYNSDDEKFEGYENGEWKEVITEGTGAQISGIPVDNEVAIWTDANTIEGQNEAEFKATLNLETGIDIQAWDTNLDQISGLAVTDGNFIVGNGTAWVAESGATARTSLGLGTIATQNANAVAITGGTINGTVIGGTTPAAGSFTTITGISGRITNGISFTEMVLYRATNTIGSGNTVTWKLNNANSVETVSGFINNNWRTNALGSENSRFEFSILKNGVITEVAELSDQGFNLLTGSLTAGATTVSSLTNSGNTGTGTRLGTWTSSGGSGAITNGSDGQVMTLVSGAPAWADNTAGISFGTNDQIPFTNLAADDFDYSSNFTFNGSNLTLNSTNGSFFINNGTDIFFESGASESVNAIIWQQSTNTFAIRSNEEKFEFVRGASTVAGFISESDGGMVWGSPTGGSQGIGTINAVGVYDNGVLLTDYVFEKEFTGNTIDERWKSYNRKSLIEEIEFVEKNYHLSTMIGREEWEKKKASNGELISQLWETIETQFLYIKELEERISKLENK